MAKRILIIDDDKDMLDMLQIILQDSNCEVILQNSGLTGTEVSALQPDLVLLDVQIKGYQLTGNEICNQIKALDVMAHVPVFLMSSDHNLRELAEECHAEGYFPKPFDINSLKYKLIASIA